MKWAYDLSGAEPIISDCEAYDATTIVDGELLMKSATLWSAGSGAGQALISAYSTTVASVHAVNAVGIALETKTTADTVSVATAVNTTAEAVFVKTIINPLAIYRAEVPSSDSLAITSWTTTHLVFGANEVAIDSADGVWIYMSASAGPNFGELRLCVLTDAAGSCDLVTNVVATATTADEAIFIMPRFHISNALNIEGTGVTAVSTGTGLLGAAVNLRVIQSYIDQDAGLEILKTHIHDGINARKAGTNAPAKFFSDIQMIDNLFIDSV